MCSSDLTRDLLFCRCRWIWPCFQVTVTGFHLHNTFTRIEEKGKVNWRIYPCISSFLLVTNEPKLERCSAFCSILLDFLYAMTRQKTTKDHRHHQFRQQPQQFLARDYRLYLRISAVLRAFPRARVSFVFDELYLAHCGRTRRIAGKSGARLTPNQS